MVNFQSYLSDFLPAAVEAVLLFDIPDADFAQAVQAQACLLSGSDPADLLWHYE